MRTLIILTICTAGCASTSVTSTVSENDKDVLILSILVQDHLRKTNGRDINLAQADTSNRISKSFEKVELKFKGGHIFVYYKFSASRDSKGIELSDKEKERTKYLRCTERNLKNQYDGEIRLDYGERFYRIVNLISNRTG
jgi:hypothetical protein